MKLIDFYTGKRIDRLPHLKTFRTLQHRLDQPSPDAFDAIVDHINELIDNAGAEIATAGWLPGEDWSGTPLQSIYEIAAKRHYGVAGMMFGLVEVGNNGALRPGSTSCCVSLFARPKPP